jgi:hypothetical protein
MEVCGCAAVLFNRTAKSSSLLNYCPLENNEKRVAASYIHWFPIHVQPYNLKGDWRPVPPFADIGHHLFLSEML